MVMMKERLKSPLCGHWELQHSHQRLEPESDNGANTQVFCGRTACSLFFLQLGIKISHLSKKVRRFGILKAG